MNKIKVTSFYMARLLDFLIITLPVYIIFQWIFMDSAYLVLPEISTPQGLIIWDQVVFTLYSRWFGFFAQLIGFVPFLGILYYLSKVFHQYEIGAIFTMNNAKYYYRIGILLFFDALLAQLISGGLWVAAATISNPVGKRYISISIGTPNFMAVLLGLLVIFISWVMIEGSKIQDEQQLII